MSVSDEPMYKVGGAVDGIDYPRWIITKFQMCVITSWLFTNEPVEENVLIYTW